MTLQVKFSNQILDSDKPFKIMHSIFNEESNQTGTLSVLVLKVESIGI